MTEPVHQVRLESNARFLLPRCSCGWIGTARLTMADAREEARDHALLFAGSDVIDLAGLDPAEPGQAD